MDITEIYHSMHIRNGASFDKPKTKEIIAPTFCAPMSRISGPWIPATDDKILSASALLLGGTVISKLEFEVSRIQE